MHAASAAQAATSSSMATSMSQATRSTRNANDGATPRSTAARPATFSFDVVPKDVEAALQLNACAGRQHTTPGSIGETSGTLLADGGPGLVWEVQPNVYKPTPERNREARSALQLRQHHLGIEIVLL